MPKRIGKWSILKIKKVVHKKESLRHYYLLSKHYESSSQLLKWKYHNHKKIGYYEVSWNRIQSDNYHFPSRTRWTPWRIQKYLTYVLPHTKGYTLFNVHIKRIKDLSYWRYIDKNNKPHFFLLSWYDFVHLGRRFSSISLNRKDILQEIYDSVGSRYTVFCIQTPKNYHKKIRVKIRHNSSRCNYFTHWVDAYSLIKRKHACVICEHIIHSKKARSSIRHIKKILFSQWDNHDHKYIPDLSDFKNCSQKLKWKYRHSNGITTSFRMSLSNFYQGCRPQNRESRNEKYFHYLIDKYSSLKYDKNYFHSLKIQSDIHVKYYSQRGNMSFDFYFPSSSLNITKYKGLMVELNGIQHVKPIKWCYSETNNRSYELFEYQKTRDMRKQVYCNQHHYLLLWLPCFYISKYNGNITSDSFSKVKKIIFYNFINVIKPLLKSKMNTKYSFKQLSLF